MNTFLNQMIKNDNITLTENGGVTRKHTDSKVLDILNNSIDLHNINKTESKYLIDLLAFFIVKH